MLAEKIREIHERSRGTYGYPRVHAELRELRALGVRCSRKRVARLMRKAGLQGCIRGRRKRTTCRDKHAVPAPDLVEQELLRHRSRQNLDGRPHLCEHSREGFI
jgi:putative transposase